MANNASSSAPPVPIRWFRPTISTPFLQLPTAPISVTHVDSWIALTVQESAQCEQAWQTLSEEQQLAAEASSSNDRCHPGSLEDLDKEQTVGIAISEDKLFEVDVRSMEVCYSTEFMHTQ